MGIYIDGMEMPHDGEFNHIRIYDNGDVTVEFSDGEAVIAHASSVPPHGRLIDADALNYTMLYKENWMKGTGVEAPAVWKSDIDYAPTVIPASKEDE